MYSVRAVSVSPAPQGSPGPSTQLCRRRLSIAAKVWNPLFVDHKAVDHKEIPSAAGPPGTALFAEMFGGPGLRAWVCV